MMLGDLRVVLFGWWIFCGFWGWIPSGINQSYSQMMVGGFKWVGSKPPTRDFLLVDFLVGFADETLGPLLQKRSRLSVCCTSQKGWEDDVPIFWVVVSNMFYFYSDPWGNDLRFFGWWNFWWVLGWNLRHQPSVIFSDDGFWENVFPLNLGDDFKYFWIFYPDPWGNGILFDEHFFQVGWFNHQLGNFCCWWSCCGGWDDLRWLDP